MNLPLLSGCRYRAFLFILHFCIVVLKSSDVRQQISSDRYFQERQQILSMEKKMAVGGSIVLNSKEEMVNEILMTKKRAEINNSLYNGIPFPPGLHFFQAKSLIEKSDVFQIIKKMPKGGVLHVHDISALSLDWVVKNVTYRDNCYMCYREGFRIQFKFSAKVPEDENCFWTLVSDSRNRFGNRTLFDQWLYNNMSLIVDDPVRAYPFENDVWAAFEGALHCITGLVSFAPVMKDYVYQSLKEFSQDNVQYMELRTLLIQTYELDGSVNSPLWTLEMYRNVSHQFVQDQQGNFSGLKLIYSGIRRNPRTEIANSTKRALLFSKMFPDFLVGYDLVGQEDKGHALLYFIDELLNQTTEQKLPIPYFFHAGETNWQGTSVDKNLIDAILLNTTRIGHGFAIVKHPWVMKAVKDREIAIEVNPISNQVLKLVDDLRNHPAAAYLANDLPVVISSDDGSVWGSKGLSYDFYQAFMGFSGMTSDLRLLKQLAINSLRYSAMSAPEKKLAVKLWGYKWEKFLDDVLHTYIGCGNFSFGIATGKDVKYLKICSVTYHKSVCY